MSELKVLMMPSFQVPIYKFSNDKKLTRSMIIQGYTGRKAFRLIEMGYEFHLKNTHPAVIRFYIYGTNNDVALAETVHMATSPAGPSCETLFAKMVNDFWSKEF